MIGVYVVVDVVVVASYSINHSLEERKVADKNFINKKREKERKNEQVN